VPDLRDIHDLAGCRAAVDLQTDVWGRDSETVPASLLVASIERGGVLIGAWAGDRLAGFVWSMPGLRHGRPTQWSHMLGVRPEFRGQGLGEALKRAQRDRALAAGVDLIEWTFDPLQAPNAHLNLSRLGATASEYRVNAYGEMSGPLHRGTPTDRLVAEWWIRRPPTVDRLARRVSAGASRAAPNGGDDLRGAPSAISTREAGAWTACAGARTDLDAPRVFVPVPPRFSEMQQQATELALAWRLGVRDALNSYLTRDFLAVDFRLNRERGGGAYVLARASGDMANQEPL